MTDTMTEQLTGEPVAEGEHVILTLDRQGDSRFSWNPRNQAEVDNAEAHFKNLKSKGYLAYRVRNGEQTAETVSDWERDDLASAGEIVMVPQTVGG